MRVFRFTGEVARQRDLTDTGGSMTRRRRTWGLVAAVGALVAAVPVLAVSGVSTNAANGVAARSQVKDVGGMPTWYEDANGVRLEPCYDPNDPNCTAPISATYNPALPLSATNYPDEMFYSAADSAPILNVDESANCAAGGVTAGVTAGAAGIWGHMALEASYFNGTLTPGDQMVFGRIRITARAGSGLCPGAWYTFRTPYGPMTVQTAPNGDPQRAPGSIEGAVASAATYDVGCVPAPTAPCNFDLALGAPVLKGLLRQSTAAAPGYLGSGLGLDTIVGSPISFNQFDVVRWPDGVTPAGSGFGVDCTSPSCTTIASTNQFSVLAKVARPIATSVNTLDFGGQNDGTTSAAKTVALTINGGGALGLNPVTLDNVTITGANAADFHLATTGCSIGAGAVAMARDASCGIDLTFAPATPGAKTATLNVFSDGSATPTATVTLLGTGINVVQAPAATFTPADGNVVFGPVRITQVSATQNIVITNSGTAPLQALPAIATGVDSGNFTILTDTCSAAFVPAGGSCTVGVQFIPAQARLYSALLNVHTNLPSGAITFALSANGTGGIAAVSPTLGANTFPEWYQDEQGVRLGQCADSANPLCITAPLPNAGPQSFPGNYPDEWFYYLATSAPLSVTDPACEFDPKGNPNVGTAFVEAGTEGAFLGPIVPNGGITFGRLRIIARGGLCPNQEYLFTHPYGRTVIITDDLGNIKPQAGTTDVGCLGAPCDYALALGSPVSEGYMIQDVRPAGYIGDPIAPSTATGAPYIDPATGQPSNHFIIQPIVDGVVGAAFASTDQFAISGHLVGPMTVSPVKNDFGTVAVAGGTATQDFTFTNEGIAPVNVTSAAIETGHTTDFSITADTCTPVSPATSVTLAVGATCAVTVQFDPTVTGVRSSQLVLHHSGRNNPLAAALTGTGGAGAGLPAISTPLSTIGFTDLQINKVSQSAVIVVSNIGGQAPLIVGTTPKSGTNPAQFTVTNQCPGNNLARPGTVAPGATCKVLVKFAPTAVGVKSAIVTINSNAGALTVNLTGKATNVVAAVSASTTDAGFASWIQDDNGIRLEQCLVNDGNCVLLPDPTYNPALPVVWPTNYPLESFYSLADSEQLNFPANPACGSAGGFALLRIGTESTFTSAIPTAGAQTTFNRLRVTAAGLCPNTTYKFVHPYGEELITTDAVGDIKPKNGTFDLTNLTTSRPVSPGFLQWDPNVAPAAPAGYVGDPRALHPVVGGQYIPVGETEPANYFRVVNAGTGAVVGQVNNFLLSGRLAGPVVVDVPSKDFGPIELTRLTPTQTFTFTNVGSAPLTGVTRAVTGTDAALFTITGGTCGNTVLTLQIDASCTIIARFTAPAGTALGNKSATLTLSHGGLRSPISIPLTGSVIAALTPSMTVTPATLAFGTVNVGTTSTAQVVTIRNPVTTNIANTKLRLTGVTIGGLNADQYLVSASTCWTTDALGVRTYVTLTGNTSCTVSLQFKPTANGAKAGTVTVTAVDGVTVAGHVAVTIPNATVTLSGTGASPVVSVPATLAIAGTAGRATTGRLTVTNTGTANLNLASVGANPALYYQNPADPATTVRLTATGSPAIGTTLVYGALTHNCTNILPGRTCTINVPWTTPAALAINGTQQVKLVFTTNASNSTAGQAVGKFVVTVTGTRTR